MGTTCRTMAVLSCLAFLQAAPALGSGAGGFQPWFRATLETDSSGLDPSRHEVTLGTIFHGGDWSAFLTDTYLSGDSGGFVPRSILAENDLVAGITYSPGAFHVRPGVRFRLEPGEDGTATALPGAVLAYRKSAISPSLRIGVELPWHTRVDLHGRYASRAYELEGTGEDATWTEQQAEASLAWASPIGLDFGVAGFYRRNSSDHVDDYSSEYSRLDVGITAGPGSLPATTQVMVGAVYSFNDGLDHSGGELADRLTGHARAVQALLPGASINLDLKTFLDHDEDGFRLAGSAVSLRATAQFLRTAAVPSDIGVAVQLTNTRFVTRRLEVTTRVNVWNGLCGTARVDLRDGPTTSSLASGGTRERVILAPGVEFIMGTLVRAWLTLKNERTELNGIESWSRVDAGIEFSPGVLSI